MCLVSEPPCHTHTLPHAHMYPSPLHPLPPPLHPPLAGRCQGCLGEGFGQQGRRGRQLGGARPPQHERAAAAGGRRGKGPGAAAAGGCRGARRSLLSGARLCGWAGRGWQTGSHHPAPPAAATVGQDRGMGGRGWLNQAPTQTLCKPNPPGSAPSAFALCRRSWASGGWTPSGTL